MIEINCFPSLISFIIYLFCIKIFNFDFKMSSENQAVAAALEKHEKDKITKNVVINNMYEVPINIIICT